jgi:hypothetical protein
VNGTSNLFVSSPNALVTRIGRGSHFTEYNSNYNAIDFRVNGLLNFQVFSNSVRVSSGGIWFGASSNQFATPFLLNEGNNYILSQRNGTNAQAFRVYNTFTSTTNNEFGKLQWAGDVFRVGTEKGSGGGNARAMELQTDGTTRLTVGASGSFTVADAQDIAVGTTTGTKIGTATTQKLGFYNAAPVVQPAAVTDITTTATAGTLPTPDGTVTIADADVPTVGELLEYCVELEAKLEAALGHLRTLGLIAT